VEYWLKQPGPVMLVIGTFAGDEEPQIGSAVVFQIEKVRLRRTFRLAQACWADRRIGSLDALDKMGQGNDA